MPIVDTTGAIQITFDSDVLNNIVGIHNAKSTYFDSVNQVFIVNNIEIDSTQLNFSLNDEVSNFSNMAILSKLYSDFILLVTQYFSSVSSTVFSGLEQFSSNIGIFDAEKLLIGMSGNIFINDITQMLKYAVNNNPFNNRTNNASIFKGFCDGDSIFIPNGLEVKFILPVDLARSTSLDIPYLSKLKSYLQLFNSVELTETHVIQVVSVPLLLKLINCNTTEPETNINLVQEAISNLGTYIQHDNNITLNNLQVDYNNIHNALHSLEQTNLITATTFLNGSTISPGVYTSDAAIAVTGSITFDGQNNSNSVFVIRCIGAITTAANANMVLVNGALASNIFWTSAGAISTGANTNFIGTMMANGAISLGKNCMIQGRLLSKAAVSTNNSNIWSPNTISSIVTSNLVKFSIYAVGAISNVDGGPCIVMGSIASEGSISFATPASSPFIIIGSIYGVSPNNTGANISTQDSIYTSDNLDITYGTVGISIFPNSTYANNANGIFTLIFAPYGLTINPLSGVLKIESIVNIGVKTFYVSYYNNNIFIVSVFVLSVL